MSNKKKALRTGLLPCAFTTRDLRGAAPASPGPRSVQGLSTSREPVLPYAASGVAAAMALVLAFLLGRRLRHAHD